MLNRHVHSFDLRFIICISHGVSPAYRPNARPLSCGRRGRGPGFARAVTAPNRQLQRLVGPP